MTGVRRGDATPGQFRRTQNWIGRPDGALADASNVPPPPADLGNHLGRWEELLHDESVPPLVRMATRHYANSLRTPIRQRCPSNLHCAPGVSAKPLRGSLLRLSGSSPSSCHDRASGRLPT